MRDLRRWHEAPPTGTRITGWTVVSVCSLPWLLLSLLPESGFTMPVFVTFWFMGASGALGVYLLDATRRPKPEATWARALQAGARAVLMILGLLGSIAGGSILYRVSTTGQLLPLPSLLVRLLMGFTTVILGVAVIRWGVRPASDDGRYAAQQQDAADKRRAIGALRAPSLSRRLQLILVLCGRMAGQA